MAGRPLKSHEGLKATHGGLEIAKHYKYTLSLYYMHALYVDNAFIISDLTSLPYTVYFTAHMHTHTHIISLPHIYNHPPLL